MILIYSPQLTNRFRYVVQFIFEDVCKIEYSLTSDDQYFKEYNLAKINYSDKKISDNEIFVKRNGLLNRDGISPIEPEIKKETDSIKIFPDEESDLKFDIFSAIFYLVTRYEEYLPFQKDSHGRFEAKQSYAYKNGFLDRPVVDEWIIELEKRISTKYPGQHLEKRYFKFTPSIDVDQAFAIKGKSLLRVMKPILLSLVRFKIGKFIDIIKIRLGLLKDPFDQFELMESLHRKYNFTAIYFFLFSKKYTRYDVNISVKNKEFRKRIKEISKTASVGIHPSYHSRYDFKLIDEEIHLLSNVLNIPINSSRQHYLKLRLPNTYKSLISLGIANEYSMGYASMPGFRASTTHSFKFFDLKHEQISFLVVHPFCVMDATFKTYLNFTKEQAYETIVKLMNNVKKVDGHFISLWHNESFSENEIWKGWRSLYEEMLMLANKNY